jgi:hypothetical protein
MIRPALLRIIIIIITTFLLLTPFLSNPSHRIVSSTKTVALLVSGRHAVNNRSCFRHGFPPPYPRRSPHPKLQRSSVC